MSIQRRHRNPLWDIDLPSRSYDELWMPGVGVIRVLARVDEGELADGREPLWNIAGPLSSNQQLDSQRRMIYALQVRVRQLTTMINNLTSRLETNERCFAEYDERLVNLVYMMLPDRLVMMHRVPLLPPRGDYTNLEQRVEQLSSRLEAVEGEVSRTRAQMTMELNEVYTRARLRRASSLTPWDIVHWPSSRDPMRHRHLDLVREQSDIIEAIEANRRMHTQILYSLHDAYNGSRTPINDRRVNQMDLEPMSRQFRPITQPQQDTGYRNTDMGARLLPAHHATYRSNQPDLSVPEENIPLLRMNADIAQSETDSITEDWTIDRDYHHVG